MTAYPPLLRPADTRCGHPHSLMDIAQTSISLDHRLGYYLSTYCEHGMGEGRGKPSLCRVSCKSCGAPCVCVCHQGRIPPFEGYDREQEQQIRDRIVRIIRDKQLAPYGPRGDELISDIITAALHRLDRDGHV